MRRPGYNKKTVLALLLVFAIAGCDLFGGPRSSQGEIEQEIIFDLVERSALGAERPEEPSLYFAMRTNEDFPCVNYPIRYQLDRDGDRVRIQVLEIVRPDVCLTAIGPANASFDLALPSGTYRFLLVNGRRVDRYSVTVTDTRIELEPQIATWTTADSPLNWTFPHDSFGYYCGTLIETKDLCTDFEARLQDLPLTAIDVPDVGQWPYPLSSAGHYYDAPARFYHYPEPATWQKVKERLRTYTRERLSDQEGTGLSVQNWLGDAVRSWMVDGV